MYPPYASDLVLRQTWARRYGTLPLFGASGRALGR